MTNLMKFEFSFESEWKDKLNKHPNFIVHFGLECFEFTKMRFEFILTPVIQGLTDWFVVVGIENKSLFLVFGSWEAFVQVPKHCFALDGIQNWWRIRVCLALRNWCHSNHQRSNRGLFFIFLTKDKIPLILLGQKLSSARHYKEGLGVVWYSGISDQHQFAMTIRIVN